MSNKAANDAHLRAIEETMIIRLSAEDQSRFALALLDPPAPSDDLREARTLHAENVEMR
jgi:uncharacterized protein (DUF1778 family)